MNNYLSKKLSFFSFWLIILVIILHSLNIELASCNEALCYAEYVLSYKIAQVAVPLFFFISGYLFFIKFDLKQNFDFSIYRSNLKKRSKSILLPYILWCLFWYFLMYSVQYLPVVKDFYTQPLRQMSSYDKLLNLFYYPLNYPFWFLRELMVIIILSPFIFIFTKFLKIYFVIFLFIAAIFMEKILSVNSLTILSSYPLLFFCIGSYCSLNKIKITFNTNMVTLFLLLLLSSVLIFISVMNDIEVIFDRNLKSGFDLIRILISSFAVWYFYDHFNKRKQWFNYSYYRYSFFIYAAHGIPTIILAKLSEMLFRDNSSMLAISYLLIIVLITIISIMIGKMVQKASPKVYNILTGSRT